MNDTEKRKKYACIGGLRTYGVGRLENILTEKGFIRNNLHGTNYHSSLQDVSTLFIKDDITIRIGLGIKDEPPQLLSIIYEDEVIYRL